jgi:MFS family permease
MQSHEARPSFPPVFWLLFTLNFSHMMIQNLLNTMPAYLAALGQTETVIGFFQVIPSLGLVVFIVLITLKPLGSAKRLVLRMGFGLSALGLLFSILFFESMPVLFAGRVLMAIGYGSGFSLLFSMMYDHTNPEQRFRSASVFGISGLLTNALGSLISESVYNNFHTWPVFLPPLCFAFCAFLLTFRLRKDHERHRPLTGLLDEVIRRFVRHRLFARLTVLTLMFGCCFAVFWNFIVRVSQVRLGEVNITPFFIMFTIIAVLNRTLLTGQVQKLGYRKTLVACFVLLSAALVLFYGFSMSWQLYFIGAIYAVAHSVLYPFFSSAFVSMEIEDKSLVNNYFILLFTVGSTGSTQIFALIADHYGFSPIILMAVFVAAIAVIISLSVKEHAGTVPPLGSGKETP